MREGKMYFLLMVLYNMKGTWHMQYKVGINGSKVNGDDYTIKKPNDDGLNYKIRREIIITM